MSSPFNIKTGVRIPELDGLRGLAILLVVFYHCVFSGLRPEAGWLAAFIHALFPLAWSGVDLFFVLSGFLIGGILMDQRNTESYFKTFYIRRVCRIFPLYFLWLALFAIFSCWFLKRFHQPWVTLLFDQQGIPNWLYVFFLQNFHIAKHILSGSAWLGVTWSLAVEEQFYLFLPLLIWLTPARKLPQVLTLLVVLTPVFRLFLYLYHPELFLYVLLPCRADTLLMGVLCACLIRRENSRRWLERHQDRLLMAFVVLLAGIGYLTVKVKTLDFWNAAMSFDMVFLGYSWIAFFYACLLLIAVTAKKGMIVSIMRFSSLRYLGIISYGIFLIHMTVDISMHGLLPGRESSITSLLYWVVVLVGFLVTLLLATLSWRFFEKPVIQWGHSFSYTNKKIRPSA